MAIDPSAPRSRRALLAAAAGGAAALAASAAMPLAAAAHDADDVQKDVDNPTTATTSITNATADSTALAASAVGLGYGLEGTSAGAAGVFAWSVSPPDPSWFSADLTSYTGVFGSSPVQPDPNTAAVGVWGDSPDFGVYGTGSVGVYGYGSVGVIGSSTGTQAGVLAFGSSAGSLALDVRGKVKFSRSGRATIGRNKSSVRVNLSGVSASSRIFAVCYSNRSSRWVRAAVPHGGYFNIYMNAKVSSSTYVSWFVLD